MFDDDVLRGVHGVEDLWGDQVYSCIEIPS